MRSTWSVVCGVLAGCAAGGLPEAVEADPEEQVGTIDGTAGVPDVRCAGAPDAGPRRSFRHFRSKLVSRLGGPKHRGLDLVTSADAATQRFEGWISYSLID